MTDFTLDYWQTELRAFKNAVAEDSTPEATLATVLRGILYLGHLLIQEDPTRSKVLLADVRVCFDLAEERMGGQWLCQQLPNISTHVKSISPS